jgi:hypothetical protein
MAGRVAALREIVEALGAYTSATGRPAIPDAVLLDILDEREEEHGSGADYTVQSADNTMLVLLNKGLGLSIDGYFWDALSDQTSDMLAEHGLAEEAEVL